MENRVSDIKNGENIKKGWSGIFICIKGITRHQFFNSKRLLKNSTVRFCKIFGVFFEKHKLFTIINMIYIVTTRFQQEIYSKEERQIQLLSRSPTVAWFSIVWHFRAFSSKNILKNFNQNHSQRDRTKGVKSSENGVQKDFSFIQNQATHLITIVQNIDDDDDDDVGNISLDTI